MLKGKTIDDLLNVVDEMAVIEDTKKVVREFRRKNYIVGIISNGYSLIANYVKQKIGADFSLAYNIEFAEGKTTGEVNPPHYFFLVRRKVFADIHFVKPMRCSMHAKNTMCC